MNTDFPQISAKKIIADIRSKISIIGLGVVLCGIIILCLLLSTFYVEIYSLRLAMYLSPHPMALILAVVLLMPYSREREYVSSNVIIVAIILLIVSLSALLFLVLTVVSVLQLGCVGILACNNIRGIFITVLILIILLVLIEFVMFLYLLVGVRASVDKKCYREEDIESKLPKSGNGKLVGFGKNW